jgi:hypothetical protein
MTRENRVEAEAEGVVQTTDHLLRNTHITGIQKIIIRIIGAIIISLSQTGMLVSIS